MFLSDCQKWWGWTVDRTFLNLCACSPAGQPGPQCPHVTRYWQLLHWRLGGPSLLRSSPALGGVSTQPAASVFLAFRFLWNMHKIFSVFIFKYTPILHFINTQYCSTMNISKSIPPLTTNSFSTCLIFFFYFNLLVVIVNSSSFEIYHFSHPLVLLNLTRFPHFFFQNVHLPH